MASSSISNRLNSTWPRRRIWTIVRGLIGLAVCIGALGWTIQAVLRDNRAAKEAIRAMRSRYPSERVDGILELQTSGIGDGAIAIPALTAALRDPDPTVRAAAAQAIGPIGTAARGSDSGGGSLSAAVAALLGSLKDPESAVRVSAANSLGYIMASAGIAERVDINGVQATLVENLGDLDPEHRLAALRVLSAVALVSGSEPPAELATALEDESAQNRAMAVAALAAFPRGLGPWIPSVFWMMEHDEAIVRAACEKAMARVRPPAVSAESLPVLTEALGSPDRRIQAAAVSLLVELGREAQGAIPALIATALEKRDASIVTDPFTPDLSTLAIHALGRIAPGTDSADQAMTALIEILKAEEPTTYSAALYALEQFRPASESIVPELIHVLRKNIAVENPSNCGGSAVMALGQFAPGTNANRPAVAALTEALAARSSTVRYGAAFALRRFGPESTGAIPRLRALTKDPDAAVRGAARDTLLELTRSAQPPER